MPKNRQHPSVTATLCDYIQHNEIKEGDFLTSHHRRLHEQYNVRDWNISFLEFVEFVRELGRTRCATCGDDDTLYYIPGDRECVRCTL